MVREAHAIWKDGQYAGEGTLSTPSEVLSNSEYTFGSLMGPAASTSPCEMLAAAISSSMSGMVSVEMTKLGIRPVQVETNTALTLDFVGESLRIVEAHLKIIARTRDFENGQFTEAVEAARYDCPVSSILNVNIQCEAKLVSVAVQACA
jgi:osmotically inducible protein OsmC